MQTIITVETPIAESARVQQVHGIFDLPMETTSRLQWTVSLPLGERPWNIGLITGPSGCGKSTIARHFWPDHIHREFSWPAGASLLDAFPAQLPIKDVTALLSAVFIPVSVHLVLIESCLPSPAEQCRLRFLRQARFRRPAGEVRQQPPRLRRAQVLQQLQ